MLVAIFHIWYLPARISAELAVTRNDLRQNVVEVVKVRRFYMELFTKKAYAPNSVLQHIIQCSWAS